MICSSVNRFPSGPSRGPPRGHPKPNPHPPHGGVFGEHVDSYAPVRHGDVDARAERDAGGRAQEANLQLLLDGASLALFCAATVSYNLKSDCP